LEELHDQVVRDLMSDENPSDVTYPQMPAIGVTIDRRFDGAPIPAVAWPSSNEYGVPDLLLEYQATSIPLPFVRWGRETRKSRMRGTWHFYTADERFESLRKRPQHLTGSACLSAVEPNFSVLPHTPRAVALMQTFRKRWLARTWQSYGVRVLVDLNVAEEHAADNLLGVPCGWTAYATRGSALRLEELERDYNRAHVHARLAPLLFVVYGGGHAVRDLCTARGWTWIPEEADMVRRRSVANG
jgi:hypothetical protein